MRGQQPLRTLVAALIFLFSFSSSVSCLLHPFTISQLRSLRLGDGIYRLGSDSFFTLRNRLHGCKSIMQSTRDQERVSMVRMRTWQPKIPKSQTSNPSACHLFCFPSVAVISPALWNQPVWIKGRASLTCNCKRTVEVYPQVSLSGWSRRLQKSLFVVGVFSL